MDLLRMDRHTTMLEIFVGDWIANFRSSLTADLQLSQQCPLRARSGY